MITAADFLKFCNVFGVKTGGGGGGGGITSLTAGTGLSGGTITTSGTIAFAAIAAHSLWMNLTGGSAVPTVVPVASAPWLQLTGGTMTGAINMFTFPITNLAEPSAGSDAATKNYADSIAAGLTPVGAVYCATTANLTGYVYNNGVSGVGATLTAPGNGVFTADSATPPVGQPVLYKDDTTGLGAYNGIYSLTVSSAGAPAVLTRVSYFNSPSNIVVGALVSVSNGATQKGSSWTQNNTVNTVGVDPLAFSIFFNPSMYLQKTNNLSDLADIPTAVSNLSLTIGVNTQAFSAALTSIAGLTTIANNLIYTTGANAYAALAPTANRVLITGAGGAPSWTLTLPPNIVLVTADLGTPSAGVLTNCTGLPISTGVSGLGTGVAAWLASATSAHLQTAMAGQITGTGDLVFALSPTLVTPALGTPSSGVLTNCTGYPAAGIAGLASGIAAWLAAPTSANLLAAMTTKSGTGLLVFTDSPAFTTPSLGVPSSGTLTNCTGLPLGSITGLGTGVATALAAAVTGSGGIALAISPSFTTPALGTPSAGVLTNCTGLPLGSITGLGTGVATALAAAVTGSGGIVLATSPTLVTPALGTPSSGVLTNCTGLPLGSITGLGTGVATALAAAVTGSGGIVLATSPTLVTPAIGTPSAGILTNCTGLPLGSITGLGTGVATALAAAVTGSGGIVLATSPTLVTPALGTPSSGNLANCTGYPFSSITGTLAPQGRLTLTSNTPVTTTDVSGVSATTIFYTPYVGNIISLFDGSSTWNILNFTQLSIAVPSVATQMYDVFCFNNSGTPTLELLAWTNDSTRATALIYQNGILVKSGATTRRYLGSMRTVASAQSEDSGARRFLWNYYNRVGRALTPVAEGTDTWNYSTATYRQANANTANQLNFIVGVSEDFVYAQAMHLGIINTGTSSYSCGIGVNVTNANSAQNSTTCAVAGGNSWMSQATYYGLLPVGYNFLSWLEIGHGSNTNTWLGDNGLTTIQTGITGNMRA